MVSAKSILDSLVSHRNCAAGCVNPAAKKNMSHLPKSAPPLPFNIPVPSSRNVLLFCTPSAFPLFILTILAHMCLPVSCIMYLVM